VPNFELAQGVTLDKIADRKALLSKFDTMRRDADATGQLDALDRFGKRAWDILTSKAARDAFDLDKEPERLRERYGWMEAFDPKASDRCGSPPGASASSSPAVWWRRACGW